MKNSHSARRMIGTAAVVAALMASGAVGYGMYGRAAALSALVLALHGQACGSMPADIEWHLDSPSPERLSGHLKAGFEVVGSDAILWSFRSYEFQVRTVGGVTLACDVYYRPQWLVSCGELPEKEHAIQQAHAGDVRNARA